MSHIRIAYGNDQDGTPIYTTTLKLVLGELMETETVRRDAEMDQVAAHFSEQLGIPVGNDQGHEEGVIGDAFFNCEFICELHANGAPREENEYRLAIMTAAETFNAALPELFQSRYPTAWLFDVFFKRL